MNPSKTENIQEEVLQFLLTTPTPQQIIDFRASESAQKRLQYLLEANRKATISSEEADELEELSRVNHFFTLLKARARQKLNVKRRVC